MKDIIGKLAILPSAFLMTSIALAQEEDSQDEDSDFPVIESCVNSRILRSPEVIDNRTIVFHASRNRIYLNRLPSNCIGLKQQGRISHQKTNRLCANDWFDVLERAGSELRLGMSCKFGAFQLITEEDLENLRNPEPVQPAPQPVEPPEIEDISED